MIVYVECITKNAIASTLNRFFSFSLSIDDGHYRNAEEQVELIFYYLFEAASTFHIHVHLLSAFFFRMPPEARKLAKVF